MMRPRPPKRVLVSPHDFTIKKDKNLVRNAESVGLCGEDTQEILIDAKLGLSVEQETVLHELLHAVIHQTGLDKEFDDKQEESIAWSLAPRLLALLRDNPELVTYLLSSSTSRTTGRTSSSPATPSATETLSKSHLQTSPVTVSLPNYSPTPPTPR